MSCSRTQFGTQPKQELCCWQNGIDNREVPLAVTLAKIRFSEFARQDISKEII